MARCNKIGNKNNVVCIGDMNRKVDLLVKTLTPSGDSGVDYSLTYTVVDTIWAVVRTDEGRDFFDSTQKTGTSQTHTFYVRYRVGITQEHVLKYNDEYYNILKVTNLGEESRFLKLTAAVRGPTTESVNDT